MPEGKEPQSRYVIVPPFKERHFHVFPLHCPRRQKDGFPKIYFHDQDQDLFEFVESWLESRSRDGTRKLPLIVDGIPKSGKTTLSWTVFPSIAASVRQKSLILLCVSLESITVGTVVEREKRILKELLEQLDGLNIQLPAFDTINGFRCELNVFLRRENAEAIVVIDEVHLGFSGLRDEEADSFGALLKIIAAPPENGLLWTILTGSTQSIVWKVLKKHIPPNGIDVVSEAIVFSTSFSSSSEMLKKLYDELHKEGYLTEDEQSYNQFLSYISLDQRSCSTAIQVLAWIKQLNNRNLSISDRVVVNKYFNKLFTTRMDTLERDYCSIFNSEELLESYHFVTPSNKEWRNRIFLPNGNLSDPILHT